MTAASLLSAVVALVGVNGTPRADCFPLEKLSPPLRAEAEALLLKLMDGEALYTVVGGLKPMSSGWLETRIDVENPDHKRLEELRSVFATFRVGDDLVTYLQPFTATYEGKKALSGVVVHRPHFAQVVRDRATLFGAFGITESASPIEAILAFDADATPRRNRAYGYLFGYPDYAVDFFVESEESFRKTKQFVKRDFFSVPVFGGKDHHFVWAIPKGANPRPEDLKLKAAAAPILAYYTRKRSEYIGPGKPGIVALLRDWMDDGKGMCSPETALEKTKVP